jgi:Fe-S oxidoreductase
MKLEKSTAYVNKCFNGEPASCSYACPFNLDIRSFMEKAEKGRWLPAYRALRNSVVFPVIVSALCPQPCRDHCQRSTIGDEAIAVRDLECAVIKYTKSRKAEVYTIPPKTQRIAVVGAGAAGLSCALILAQKMFPVTVFEKDAGWGGALRGHPRFEEFNADIALQFSAVQTQFRFNAEIKSLDELAYYDAVYIATGSSGRDFGLINSWDADLQTTEKPGIFLGGGVCGLPLMESIAQGPEVSKTIEVYLQTGKAAKTHGDYDRSKCNRYLRHDGAPKAERVIASSPEGYTEEEARQEAARCFKCDCGYCEKSCEMLKWYRKKPHTIGVEVYSDSNANPPFSSRTITRETYSCNICGKCQSVCPESVDIGALLQLSRADRLRIGDHIPAYHDFWLRMFDFNTSEAYLAALPKGKTACEYAFFPGCQLGAATPDHVIKSYAYLSSKYDTGIILGCCGAPAYWAGDEKRLAENTEKIKKHWIDFGKPTFVFACSYCEQVFRLYLPEIQRVSLYELLAQDSALTPARPFITAAVFDPCTAGSDSGMQAGVRKLAAAAGTTLEELKEPNRCCGYGGHMRLANPELYEEITNHRAEASDQPYIVYCANCKEIFKLKGKECAHILDMVFSQDATKQVPSLQSKKENSLEVKKEIMKKLSVDDAIDFKPEAHEWDSLKLVISGALLEDMDRRLIITDDLKEAIWLAEETGDKFINETDGICQCSMVKSVLTYWVQYKKLTPNTYEIYSAFTHRMHFSKED